MAAHRQQRVYPGNVWIIEQPCSFRFRYKSETGSGRTAGSIPGVNNISGNKSFPKIQIQAHDRHYIENELFLVVSCVTTEQPYLAHPNKLIGDECVNGVLMKRLPKGTTTFELKQIGILRVTVNEVSSSLEERKLANIDPYKNGFDHKSNQRSANRSLNLKAVRLCFQVFYWDTDLQKNEKKLRTFCEPVVSDIIKSEDKNTVPDLAITRLSDCISYADGEGKDIILWCGNVSKNNIEVIFFQEDEHGEVIWEAKATKIEVQKRNSSIAFKAPAYANPNVEDVVKVKLKLFMPSDASEGEARDFLYLPASSVCTCKYYRNFVKSLENNVTEIPKASPKFTTYDKKRARFDRDLPAMTKTLQTLDMHAQTFDSRILSMDWSGACNDVVKQNEFRSDFQFTKADNQLKEYGQSTMTFFQQQTDQQTYPLNVCSSLNVVSLDMQYPTNEQTNAGLVADNRIPSISENLLFNSDELGKLAADTMMDINPDIFLNFEAIRECDFQPTSQPTQPQGLQQLPSNNYYEGAYSEPGPSNYNMKGTWTND